MNDNTVSENYRCPNCSENYVDKLEINEDDCMVTCLTCGNEYIVHCGWITEFEKSC